MAFVYKILGQYKPAVNTTVHAYTVPATTQAIVSSIVVCNQHTTDIASYSISIVPKDVVQGNEHFIYKLKRVLQGDTIVHKLGIGLAEGDTVRVFTPTGNVSFSVFGTETPVTPP